MPSYSWRGTRSKKKGTTSSVDEKIIPLSSNWSCWIHSSYVWLGIRMGGVVPRASIVGGGHSLIRAINISHQFMTSQQGGDWALHEGKFVELSLIGNWAATLIVIKGNSWGDIVELADDRRIGWRRLWHYRTKKDWRIKKDQRTR